MGFFFALLFDKGQNSGRLNVRSGENPGPYRSLTLMTKRMVDMCYFVRTSEMKWGHDTLFLVEALRKAEVEQMTLASTQAEALEESMSDEDYSVADALKYANEHFAFERDEARKHPENYTVEVEVATPKDMDWEFAGVNPVDGMPSYKWTGEDEPPKLELNYKRFNFNKMTGEFTPV